MRTNVRPVPSLKHRKCVANLENVHEFPRRGPSARSQRSGPAVLLPSVYGAERSRAQRAARDGERRGRVAGGQSRGALHRFNGGIVVRQHWLRTPGNRRRHACAGAEAAVLPYVRIDVDGPPDPALAEADRDVAGTHVQGFLRQFGFGRERYPGQARLVLQQRPGPAAQEKDHRAQAWLSRRDRRDGGHDRLARTA
jgi:hypothetical protein